MKTILFVASLCLASTGWRSSYFLLKGSFIMDSRGTHKGGDFILPEEADNNQKN